MGFWSFLNRGWNLPYLVLLGLVAVFFALQLVGLMGGDDADADVDGDLDGLADAGHGVLSFLGVGRVPLMVVWCTFCIWAGFTGLAVNRWLFEAHAGRYPVWGLPASLGAAAAVGLAAVRLFSRLAARLVDTGGKGAPRRHQLTGRMGVVASSALDARHGEVRVRDAQGNELLVHARLDAGDAQLERGARVVLLAWDEQRGLFRASAPAGRDE